MCFHAAEYCTAIPKLYKQKLDVLEDLSHYRSHTEDEYHELHGKGIPEEHAERAMWTCMPTVAYQSMVRQKAIKELEEAARASRERGVKAKVNLTVVPEIVNPCEPVMLRKSQALWSYNNYEFVHNTKQHIDNVQKSWDEFQRKLLCIKRRVKEARKDEEYWKDVAAKENECVGPFGALVLSADL